MAKEPVWKYPAFACLVAVMNLAGMFIALFAVQLASAVSEDFYYTVAKQECVTASLVLFWTALVMGFLQGVYLRRSMSALAVPSGSVFVGGLTCIAFISEHYLNRESAWPILLVVVIAVPAMAALSARHGSRWAAQRDRRELAWLAAMLLVFTLLLFYNRELFSLVPDRLRWRVWNCPL